MSKVTIVGNAGGTGTVEITAPNTNTDRTLTLPDGAGTVATQEYVGTQAIGVGQTWQGVLASRAADTTYTNSTGRPIMVAVTAGAATYSYCFGWVDGVTIIEQQSRDVDSTTSQASVIFIVPAGSTYKVTVNVNGNATDIANWQELR